MQLRADQPGDSTEYRAIREVHPATSSRIDEPPPVAR
jgi:hypothetical protein